MYECFLKKIEKFVHLNYKKPTSESLSLSVSLFVLEPR